MSDGSPTAIVEWGLAERTASTVIGGLPRLGGLAGRGAGPNEQDSYTDAEIRIAAAEGIAAAAAYAGLGHPEAPPPGEALGRDAWSRVALATLLEAAAPLEETIAADIDLPGPLGPAARRAAGAAIGVEVGLAAGYAATRVLGQYDFALFGEARQARLLFVTENMAQARHKLDADREVFLRWIALHEATHVVQFECVQWLGDHMRSMARELIAGAAAGLGATTPAQFGRRLLRAPREVVRAALSGELARLLADPERRLLLDRLQATMSVIEGHAEHVMDAAAADLGPELLDLRRRLDQRRARRGGLSELLGRLLGMEAKLRQYETGKAFCDAVVDAAGPDALRRVWDSPAQLPSLAELERPALWLERVAQAAPAAPAAPIAR